MSNPEYVKVDDKLYKINTDFRVALECNQIGEDKAISDIERALAIIYLLFGEEGLNCKNQNKLLEVAVKYLSLGNTENELKTHSDKKYELDFTKCKGLIKSSFKFDYNYDPYELKYLHWYDYYNDLSNLSTSEFGNCCILNRITSILDTDESKIKDSKERKKMAEAKMLLRQKYCKEKEIQLTEEQEKSAEELYKALGLI